MAEIKTLLIFELLGRPPEHLKETLLLFLDKIGKETGVKIINSRINEPKRVEKAQQELYSTFAEVEADFKDLTSLMRAAFAYMPSHIEVISPAEINMKNFELNSFMNELVIKMHRYDELAKGLVIEKHILESKLQEKMNAVPVKQEETKDKATEKKVKKSRKKKKE
ncbi:hypothetical protein A3K73_07895 [Candidatus Pacearchaeota archaeon RBG_13_36_9]|nr:MAG: hypothetical protein A3K73_07895 [Candidatus Pacearchaeota archaeon RBG_13_36_9]